MAYKTSVVNTSDSQSVTYEAEGEKEDYSSIITNIDPDHNMFLSELPTEADATQTEFNWLTENLKPPARNAHLEMEDYSSNKVGSLERRKNTVQFFQTTGRVSDAQRKTAKQYNQQDEFPRQKEIAFKQMARDMEFAMMDSVVHRAKKAGLSKIVGYYYPTAKNNMVREFYNTMGFTKVSEDAEGNTVWEFEIPADYTDKNTHIQVEGD